MAAAYENDIFLYLTLSNRYMFFVNYQHVQIVAMVSVACPQGDDRSPPLPISSDFHRCLWQRSKIADEILINNWIGDNSVFIL
jgi:hypothetical protein